MTRRAFTLLEIIAVVAIIGFIFGIALVKLDGIIPSAKVKKQSRLTADLLELGFTQAAVEGRDLAVRFNREERTMTLEYYLDPEEAEALKDDTFGDDEAAATRAEEELKPLFVRQWEPDLQLSTLEVETYDQEAQRDFIIFRPEGSCDGAKLSFVSDAGYSQELELWPLLGKVVISPLKFNGE